jgi:hypothetical protein
MQVGGALSTEEPMPPPIFYFAIGARFSRRDLEVALRVGQRHFLVPGCTSGANALFRCRENVTVVLDSGAWPLNNLDRPSLRRYADEIWRWQQRDQHERFAWALTYDHLGNPTATERDHEQLLALLRRRDPYLLDEESPVTPVLQYNAGRSTADGIVGDLLAIRACWDDDEEDYYNALVCHGQQPVLAGRPACAIGGLVPQRYSDEASGWLDHLLTDLERAATQFDPSWFSIHLLGVARPDWVRRSPLIASYDSSGPAIQASFGWQKIAPSYDERYGLSPAKLQRSREARLAYWLMHYRDAGGLTWSAVAEDELADDRSSQIVIDDGFRQIRLDMLAA